ADRIIVVSGTDKYTLIVRGEGAYYAGAETINGKTTYMTFDDIDWSKVKAGTQKEVRSTVLDNELMPTAETRSANIVKVNTAANRIIIKTNDLNYVLIERGVGAMPAGKDGDGWVLYRKIDWDKVKRGDKLISDVLDAELMPTGKTREANVEAVSVLKDRLSFKNVTGEFVVIGKGLGVIARLYMGTKDIKGTHTDGVAIVYRGKSVNQLPSEVIERLKKELGDINVILGQLGEIFYFSNDDKELFKLIPELDLQGYTFNTPYKIAGSPDWEVSVTVTKDGRFSIGRAYGDSVLEKATIIKMPGLNAGYSIDFNEYKDKKISKVSTRMATRQDLEFKIIREISTITVDGIDQHKTLEDLSATVNSLPGLSAYFPQGSQEYEKVLRELANELEQGLKDLSNSTVYAGKQKKITGGTYVVYRRINSPEIIAQENPDGTIQINLAWNDEGQSTRSLIAWKQRLVDGKYKLHILSRSASEKSNLVQLLENSDPSLDGRTMLSAFNAQFRKAQEKVQKLSNKPIEVKKLADFLSHFGVDENTPLVELPIVSYEKHGLIFDGKLAVDFDTDEISPAVLYLLPQDPLGRVFIEKRLLSDGFILTINMWHWQEATGAPYGVLPGSVSIRFTKGESLLNRIQVSAEEVKVYDGREDMPSQITAIQRANVIDFVISNVNIAKEEQPVVKNKINEDIAAGRIQIKLIDAQSRETVVEPVDIVISFGSIHFEIAHKGKEYATVQLTYTGINGKAEVLPSVPIVVAEELVSGNSQQQKSHRAALQLQNETVESNFSQVVKKAFREKRDTPLYQSGYLYSIHNGGYSIRELYTPDGRLYKQAIRNTVSYFMENFLNTETILYYDLRVPFLVPIRTTGAESGRLISLKFDGGLQQQEWKMDTGWKKYVPLLYVDKESSRRFYEADGTPGVVPTPPLITLFSYKFFLIAIGIMVGWKLLKLFYSFISTINYNRHSRNLEQIRANKPEIGLWDDAIEDANHDRMMTFMHLSTELPFILDAPSNDGNNIFMFIKQLMYGLRLRVLSIVEKTGDNVDLRGDHPLLVNLDEFCKSVSKFFGDHCSMASVSLVFDRPGYVSYSSEFFRAGHSDTEVYDKLELYFAEIAARLDEVLEEKLLNSKARTIEENEKIYQQLLAILAPCGLSETSGTFNLDYCQKLLADHNTEVFDRQTPDDVVEILKRITPEQKKSQAPLDPADYAKLKAYLATFDVPRTKRSFIGLIISVGVVLFHSVKPISLALSGIVPAYIVAAILWTLVGYLIFEAVFLLLFGGLAIRTLPYLGKPGMEKFKNKIAWRTLSISPVVSEMAYYLPDGLLQGLSVIALYSWASGANLAIFTSGLIPVVLAIAGGLLAINIIVQASAMRRLYHGTHRVLFGLTGLSIIASAVTLSLIIPGASSLGIWTVKVYIITSLLLEAFANLVFGSSVFGVSIHRNFRPSVGFARPRAMVIRAVRFTLFALIGLIVAYFCMQWFAGHFTSAPARAIIGLVGGFGISSYLMHFGSWLLSCFLSTIFYKEDHGAMTIDENLVKEFIEQDHKIVIPYVAFDPNTGPMRDKPGIFNAFKWLYDNNSFETLQFLKEVRVRTGKPNLTDTEVFELVKKGIEALWQAEKSANDGEGASLLCLAQMDDPTMPKEVQVGATVNEETKTLIRIGFDVRRHAMMNFFLPGKGIMPLDTPIFLIDLAARMAQEGLGKNLIFFGIGMWGNQNSKSNVVAYGQFKLIFEHLCGLKVGEGNNVFSSIACDPAKLKSAALSRLFFLPMNIQRKIRLAYINDRNANSLNLDRVVFDIKRMISHPEIPIMAALRNTTNIRSAQGCQSWLVEGGHGFGMLGLNDKMGSGWCNTMRIYDQGERGYLNVMRNPAYPVAPMALYARNRYPYWRNRGRYHYGLIGLGPHVPHQSEDIGDVLCQTHNAVGLGYRPTFSLSTAQALKVRESFSAGELSAACTRWSWGLTQTKAAYIYQLVNDYGPESVYERDCRTDVSRFYVIMPIAIIGLFLVPFGIIFDCLPFAGIGATLFFIGMLFNQVSTLNGLGANIRACDGLPSLFVKPFRFLLGIIGAIAFAAAAKWLIFGGFLMPFILGVYGFFFTSAPVGFSRWLSQRARDMIIFAFRFGMEVVAQFISYEGVGLTFVTSGGGGSFDQYHGNATIRTNVYTAVYRVGVALTICHLVAFLIGLDLINALFLLPSIFFGVSMVIGPYVSENRPGVSIKWDFQGRQLLGAAIAVAAAVSVFLLTGSFITPIAIGMFIFLSFSRAIPNWGEKVIGTAGLVTGIGIVFLVNRMLHLASSLSLVPAIALNITAVALFLGVFGLAWITLVHVLPGPSFKAVKLNNPISKHIWEPFRDKVAARIGKLIGINELKNKPYLYRAIWEFVRFTIIGLAAFYIFAIVPTPDFFYMRLGNSLGKVTFVQLVQALAWGVGFIVATVIAGRTIGSFYNKTLSKRFSEFASLYEENRGRVDCRTQAVIEARLQQARIFFHQESYDYIRDCLENIDGMPFFVLSEEARRAELLGKSLPSENELWQVLTNKERKALSDRYRIPEVGEGTVEAIACREESAKRAVYVWLNNLSSKTSSSSLDIKFKRDNSSSPMNEAQGRVRIGEIIKTIPLDSGSSSILDTVSAEQRVTEFMKAHPRWEEDVRGTLQAWQREYLIEDWFFTSFIIRGGRQQTELAYMKQDNNFHRILATSWLVERYLKQQLPLIVGPLERKSGARLALSRIGGRIIPDSCGVAGPTWLRDGRLSHEFLINLADISDSTAIAEELRPAILRHETGHWVLDSAALNYGYIVTFASHADQEGRHKEWAEFVTEGVEHPYLTGLIFDVPAVQSLYFSLPEELESQSVPSFREKVGGNLIELVAEWIRMQFATEEELRLEEQIFLGMLIKDRMPNGIIRFAGQFTRPLFMASRQALIRFFSVFGAEQLLREARQKLSLNYDLGKIDRVAKMFEEFLDGLGWKERATLEIIKTTPLEGASSPVHIIFGYHESAADFDLALPFLRTILNSIDAEKISKTIYIQEDVIVMPSDIIRNFIEDPEYGITGPEEMDLLVDSTYAQVLRDVFEFFKRKPTFPYGISFPESRAETSLFFRTVMEYNRKNRLQFAFEDLSFESWLLWQRGMVSMSHNLEKLIKGQIKEHEFVDNIKQACNQIKEGDVARDVNLVDQIQGLSQGYNDLPIIVHRGFYHYGLQTLLSDKAMPTRIYSVAYPDSFPSTCRLYMDRNTQMPFSEQEELWLFNDVLFILLAPLFTTSDTLSSYRIIDTIGAQLTRVEFIELFSHIISLKEPRKYASNTYIWLLAHGKIDNRDIQLKICSSPLRQPTGTKIGASTNQKNPFNSSSDKQSSIVLTTITRKDNRRWFSDMLVANDIEIIEPINGISSPLENNQTLLYLQDLNNHFGRAPPAQTIVNIKTEKENISSPSVEEAMSIVKNRSALPAERIIAVRHLKDLFDNDRLTTLGRLAGRADLHTHSIYSDGEETPAQLIVNSWLEGLSAVALTDHETFDGVEEAIAAADIFNVRFVPGVEFSAFDAEINTGYFHILGYWLNGSNQEFVGWLKEARKSEILKPLNDIVQTRREKIEIIRQEFNRVQKDKKTRLSITSEDLQGTTPFVPNVFVLAKVALRKYARSVLGLGKTYQDYLNELIPLKNDVEKNSPKLTDQPLSQIANFSLGNKFHLVLAHILAKPGLDIRLARHLLERYAHFNYDEKNVPLFKGVEVWHHNHTATDMTALDNMVNELNQGAYKQYPLLKTVGSDYHGIPQRKISLGLGSTLNDSQGNLPLAASVDVLDFLNRTHSSSPVTNEYKEFGEIVDLLRTTINSALTSRVRDSALYKLISLYQINREAFLRFWEKIGSTESLKNLIVSAEKTGISERIFNNVLSRIESFNSSVEEVMSRSLDKAREWATRVSRNPIPRILMMIAGPTMNCGSGVVVEALAREHQGVGGSIAISVAYIRSILHSDMGLNENALIDTIVFNNKDSADSNLSIPVFSAGMPFNPLRYADMKLIELVEFLEVYYQRLQFLIEEYQPDIIHTNHLFLLNPLVQLIAPWIPVVATTHGTEQKMLSEDNRMISLVAPAVHRLDRILSISGDVSDDTQRIFEVGEQYITLIGNGFDEKLFAPKAIDKVAFLAKYGISGNFDKIVLYVGRFIKWKGLEYVIESAREYSNSNQRVLTLFVGSGTKEIVAQYRGRIAELGLQENIKIIDKWVSMEEVADFVNAADVFVLPSVREPFSLIVLQALACGCRVVAADYGGPKKLVKQELIQRNHAVLVEPIQVDARGQVNEQSVPGYINRLAYGISGLLKTDIFHQDRLAISRSVAEYTWLQIYNKVTTIYRNAIRQHVELYSPELDLAVLPQLPQRVRVVEVHPTNKCNLSCFGCPYGSLHQEGANLPFKFIGKIAEMNPEHIFILGGGDPTMYFDQGHDIVDFVHELRSLLPNASISLCTNGVIYMEERLQKDVDILRISTHGLRADHFSGRPMPDFVAKNWENIWKYFKGPVQELWATFLFGQYNALDAIVIGEELWNAWDAACQNDHSLRNKKFGFKLLYLANDSSLGDPFYAANPDADLSQKWTDNIKAIKASNRHFGKYLNSYSAGQAQRGFILPREISGTELPIRKAPKNNNCLLAKEHVLIGADGNIYPCRIQAAAAGYSYGHISNFSLEKLAIARARMFKLPLPTCSYGCRLLYTLIGEKVQSQGLEISGSSPVNPENDGNPLSKVEGLIHNAAVYGNMSTGKWLGFPERAALVARGRFYDVMPVNAQFIPSALCPSNCLACTYGRHKDEIRSERAAGCFNRDKYIMSWEDMKLYIDRLTEGGVQSLTFTGGGDPLFNPYTLDGIEYASRTKNLATCLFTEAHLITDEMADRMVNVGLRFIRFSFNAGRPITYKYVFGASEEMFYKSLSNIEKVAAAKERHGRKLGLGVGVIINPLNLSELMEIARLIQGINDRHPGTIAHIWYRPTVRYARGVQLTNPKTEECLEYIKHHPDLKIYYEIYRQFVYEGKQFPAWIFQKAMDDLKNRIKPFIERNVNGIKIFYPETRIEAMDQKEKGFTQCRACPWLTFVGPNGDVYHCVEHGLDPRAVDGNLKMQTLEEIRQSLRRREITEMINREGLDNMCPPMCMLTEQNRMFQVIADALENPENEPAVENAIHTESQRFMDEVGRKIGDGIKFMSIGFPFILGAAMGLSQFVSSPIEGGQLSRNLSSPIRFTILSLFHNRYVFFAESLGPSVIKSYLASVFGKEVNVNIVDLQFDKNVDKVLQELAENPPDIVGLSAKVLTYDQMMEILEKRNSYCSFRKKSTLFVAGNITASYTYEEVIAKHKDVLVVVGEAEEACADLILFRKGQKSLSQISNTAYWDQSQNGVALNPTRKSVNFVSLPTPDRENAAETLKHNGVVYIEFSRGCSWGGCTFCSMWGAQHKEWRHKPLDLVMQELNALQAMGAQSFEFTDSDFMGPNPSKPEDLAIYQEFARRKIKSDNKISFFVYLRVHSVYCEEDTNAVRQEKVKTLQLLKQAGLRVVNMGGDYGSNAQNKRFNKGTTKKEVEEAVLILKEIGIETIKLGMILFDPFMSFEELLEGMRFVEQSGLKDYIHFPFARLTLYEGAPLTRYARLQGILSEERGTALSFPAADFLDQRVGRLSRIFDAWHRENKPFIFAIQEIRRERKANEEVRSRMHAVLEGLRKQYYSFLRDIVMAYSQDGMRSVGEKIAQHLLKRSGLLQDLAEFLEPWRNQSLCDKLYALAVEAHQSDALVVKILEDSAQGIYLDWNTYRRLLTADQALTAKAAEAILQKTFIRVQEQVNFRNPRLHVPKPQMTTVRRQVNDRFESICEGAAILIGENKIRVRTELESLAEREDGLKLFWALDRRLSKVQDSKNVPLLMQMEIDSALKYILMLSWEIECGNDDLIFVDAYNTQYVKDLAGLKRAVEFCFNELDVNKKSSITAKKLFISVQTNQFSLDDMPRVDADTDKKLFWGQINKNNQLTSRGMSMPEIDRLELTKEVFDPVLYYQMTGLLAKSIPFVSGANVLDVGSGTGILGILTALRGASKTVLVDVNQKACELSRRNAKVYGVSERIDVRLIPENAQGRSFEVIDEAERFDLIISNPPWGEGSMVGELGRAFSNPGQTFLQYLLRNAPAFLKPNGKIILGYSSRNDYGERTLSNLIFSLTGVVDYDWQVMASLEFTRPLYSEIFYVVRLSPGQISSSPTAEVLIKQEKMDGVKDLKAFNKLPKVSPEATAKSIFEEQENKDAIVFTVRAANGDLIGYSITYPILFRYEKEHRYLLGAFAVAKEYQSRGIGQVLVIKTLETVHKAGGQAIGAHCVYGYGMKSAEPLLIKKFGAYVVSRVEGVNSVPSMEKLEGFDPSFEEALDHFIDIDVERALRWNSDRNIANALLKPESIEIKVLSVENEGSDTYLIRAQVNVTFNNPEINLSSLLFSGAYKLAVSGVKEGEVEWKIFDEGYDSISVCPMGSNGNNSIEVLARVYKMKEAKVALSTDGGNSWIFSQNPEWMSENNPFGNIRFGNASSAVTEKQKRVAAFAVNPNGQRQRYTLLSGNNTFAADNLTLVGTRGDLTYIYKGQVSAIHSPRAPPAIASSSISNTTRNIIAVGIGIVLPIAILGISYKVMLAYGLTVATVSPVIIISVIAASLLSVLTGAIVGFSRKTSDKANAPVVQTAPVVTPAVKSVEKKEATAETSEVIPAPTSDDKSLASRLLAETKAVVSETAKAIPSVAKVINMLLGSLEDTF
ncbi:MAG: GNAT family N-acetyltransferase, partial [Candidatus Omnitrophota bacterium]